jgi:hypothetical protein
VEHVSTIRELIERKSGGAAIDLEEVILVDRDVVNFLAAYELKGIELRNCPAFLRDWIAKGQLGLASDELPHHCEVGTEPEWRRTQAARNTDMWRKEG